MKTIVDEMCSCGHLKSSHADTVARGHGECEICECFKFTWVDFVTDEDIRRRHGLKGRRKKVSHGKDSI